MKLIYIYTLFPWVMSWYIWKFKIIEKGLLHKVLARRTSIGKEFHSTASLLYTETIFLGAVVSKAFSLNGGSVKKYKIILHVV